MIASHPEDSAQYDAAFEEIVNQQWDNYYVRIKKQMKGQEDQKDSVLRKRVLRFFQDYRVETELYYTPRKDIPLDSFDFAQVFQTSLFVYGIDFLSVDRISLYFEPFEVNIELYDDSHCAVSFKNSVQLMQCFFSRLVNQPEDAGSFLNIFQQEPSESVLWKELKSYTEMLFERKVWARFLTKQDSNDVSANVPQRKMMNLFKKAKIEFLNSMEMSTNGASRRTRGGGRGGGRGEGGGGGEMRRKPEVDSYQSWSSKQRGSRFSHRGPYNEHQAPHMKEEDEEDEEEQGSPFDRRERTREKNKKTSYFPDIKMKEFSRQSRPLPAIEKITNLGGKKEASTFEKTPSSSLTNAEHKGNHSKQSKQWKVDKPAEPKDSLYSNMLQEFSKYTLFDDNISEVGAGSQNLINQSGISFFQEESSQI